LPEAGPGDDPGLLRRRLGRPRRVLRPPGGGGGGDVRHPGRSPRGRRSARRHGLRGLPSGRRWRRTCPTRPGGSVPWRRPGSALSGGSSPAPTWMRRSTTWPARSPGMRRSR
jgi:hypothetical protein